ncbi:MAG: hypothetical protein QGF46_07590, partial [Planctomycetota bacterium]|nr:hypothetical protein [Planctomycetota bacterium]
MISTSRLIKFIASITLLALVSSDLHAQKQGRSTREFSTYGISFRPLKEWSDIPVAKDDINRGLIGKFSAEDHERVKVEGT